MARALDRWPCYVGENLISPKVPVTGRCSGDIAVGLNQNNITTRGRFGARPYNQSRAS